MQKHRVARVTCLIATLIVAGTILFSWQRSRPSSPPAAAVSFDWRVEGATVFREECSGCHPDGRAVGDSIPPLREHAVALYRSPGGPEYLIDVLLDGGVRAADGTPQPDVHPTYEGMDDARLAAVLNHMLTAWGNEALLREGEGRYGPEEIAARR
ncbi:MAG TPA: cytochrome c [Thermoanaerobaculia bacterium]